MYQIIILYPINKYKYCQLKSETIAGHGGVIPALRRGGQEDHKFEANVGYIVRPCLKKSRVGQEPIIHICNPSYLGG
jgi:hypothetical protein